MFSHDVKRARLEYQSFQCAECHKKVDQMTIEGHIWPGNYTRDDIQPEQKVKPIMNKR